MLLENSDVISQREKQVDERGEALMISVKAGEAQIKARADALAADLDASARGAHDSEEKSQIKNIMGKTHRRELADMRRDLVEKSADHRKGIMAVVNDYLTEVESSAALFKSPLQVLSREGMGKPEKSELLAQLQNAGPAELQSIIDYAVAKGDRLTLSAALITADRGGKRYSNIDRAKLAQDAIGPEVEAVRIRLEEIRTKLEAMKVANQIFERGAADNRDTIKAGLAARQLAARREKAGLK